MITFRNEIWDIFIQFLEKLRKHSFLVENYNSKFANRINNIYEKAVSKLNLNTTDMVLVGETLKIVSEKDLNPGFLEVLASAGKQDDKAFTTKDGERIYKELESFYFEEKKKKRLEDELIDAEKEFMQAELAHEQFVNEQNKTLEEKKAAEKRLLNIQKRIKNLEPDQDTKQAPKGNGKQTERAEVE